MKSHGRHHELGGDKINDNVMKSFLPNEQVLRLLDLQHFPELLLKMVSPLVLVANFNLQAYTPLYDRIIKERIAAMKKFSDC
jgi:hypothetical protein